MEFAKKFGELEFWKVKDEFFLPHFYPAEVISWADESLENPYVSLSFDEFKLRESVLSFQQETDLPWDLVDNIYLSARPHPKTKFRLTQLGAGKFLPGDKLYPLVRWKESREEKKAEALGDLDRMIDFNLGLASKRLGEIKKLTEKRRGMADSESGPGLVQDGRELDRKKVEIEELIEITWGRFEERINKTLRLLKGLEEQGEDIAETTSRVLEYVKSFQGGFVYFLEDQDFQVGLPGKLKELLVLRYRLEKKAWVGQSELEKRYFIEAPKEGKYQLFVSTESPSELVTDSPDGYLGEIFEKDPFRPMTFALDGKVATVSGQEREDNWLSFGKYDLEEGKHKLQIFLPQFVNLVDQENFILFARKGESMVLPLDDFLEKGRNFNLSFNYRIEGEDLPRIVIAGKLETGNRVIRLVDVALPKSEYELQFAKNFTVPSQVQKAGITIFFETGIDSKIEIENFQLTRDWWPEVVLRRTIDDADGESTIGKRPRITFRRVNPTRYEVEVEEGKEPFLLVFSESYHPGWRVYLGSQAKNGERTEALRSYFDGEIKELNPGDDFLYGGIFDTWGRKSIPEERHLLANSYANSWLIKPEDVGEKNRYRLIIEFWPQRWFYFGLVVSGVALVGCLGWLGVSKVKNGRWGRRK